MKRILLIAALVLLTTASVVAQSTSEPSAPASPGAEVPITPENAASLHEVGRVWRGAITDIALTRDESALAIGTDTGVYVYDLEDASAPITFFPVENTEVRCVEFDSSGSNIAAGTANGKVYIFNTFTGEQRAVIDASETTINDVIFTSSPFSVLAAGDDHLVGIWSMQDFSRRASLTGHSHPVEALALADNGKYVVSMDSKSILFWEVGSFFQNDAIEAGSDFVRAMAFNPARPLHFAAAVSNEGLIIDGDLGSLGGDSILPQEHPIEILTFSGDGRLLASGRDGFITLRDPNSGEPIRELEQDGYLQALRFSPDGDRLYSATNGYLVVWDTATGNRLETIDDQYGLIDSLSFSPDGRLLAASNYLNNTVVVFDTTTLTPVTILKHGFAGAVNAVTFSSDGLLLASAGTADDYSIILWDTATFKPVKTLRGHVESVRSLSFSPNSQALLSVASTYTVRTTTDGKTARLWDVRTGELIREWLPHPDANVNSGLFTPDGTTIVTVGDDKFLRLWNAVSGKMAGEAPLPFTPYQTAMDATETYALYSSTNDTNFLRFTAPGPFTPPPGYVSATSSYGVFSPDGKLIAARVNDMEITLYDIENREQVGLIQGHIASINALLFSPDGTRLVSTAIDGTLRLWAAE